ncbi:hypothetical protein EJB05_15911, partial [Eragrostis curvula]
MFRPVIYADADASELGVSYGRVANDLPDPKSVVPLLKQNGITMVRIYDANSTVLNALANTGIKVTVMVPNENLTAAATNPSYVQQWVRDNVKAYYPATLINGVAVGNEVFDSRPDLTQQLVRAMTNVQAALAKLGLADAVKVTSPVGFSAVTNSSPPSSARFRDDIQSVMTRMIQFLQQTGSYLAMNPYPFFAHAEDPQSIPLDYALGNYEPGVVDKNTGLVYHSILDAMMDATYYAVENLMGQPGKKRTMGAGSNNGHVETRWTETGWSSGGEVRRGGKPRGGRSSVATGVQCQPATVANARAYTNYVINRVRSGKTGTPRCPDAQMDVYIFALFNENQKGVDSDDAERYFGLFHPNKTKVYEFDFIHGGASQTPKTWCVANAAVGDDRLQAAMDYACGNGADCGAIQPGERCFEPNTKDAHASHAFNSYYQRKFHAIGACDFAGAASVVYQQPSKL